MENFGIKVERETYTKDGKTRYAYYVKGNIRGKDVKIAVTPPDIGGYTVLEIVFADQMEADLVITPFELKDDRGNIISGNTYAVRSVDEDGLVYECKVKPAKASDKSLLNMLLR